MNNNLITGVLAGVSGVLSYIFGPWDAMIMVLIAVVALDYITGVAYAAVSKTLSSAIGFKGLLKKVFIFVLVALSTMLDKLVPATNGAVRSAVCMFYIANEGLSILENAGRIGLPMPEALKGALVKLKDGKTIRPRANNRIITGGRRPPFFICFFCGIGGHTCT